MTAYDPTFIPGYFTTRIGRECETKLKNLTKMESDTNDDDDDDDDVTIYNEYWVLPANMEAQFDKYLDTEH